MYTLYISYSNNVDLIAGSFWFLCGLSQSNWDVVGISALPSKLFDTSIISGRTEGNS